MISRSRNNQPSRHQEPNSDSNGKDGRPRIAGLQPAHDRQQSVAPQFEAHWIGGRVEPDHLPEPVQRALLRRFEPIARFTQGELFYPIDVARYVALASLWIQQPGQDAQCQIPNGELNLDRLGVAADAEPDAIQFLKFTDPLAVRELAAYYLGRAGNWADRRRMFKPGIGRLARVGYGSRFIDALYNLALLARGRVPGDTAAAAALTYEQMMATRPEYAYHGRVVREAGWTILQYWFFYVYNNWRSGFSGANDHEADWEMIAIYLPDTFEGQDLQQIGASDSACEAFASRLRPEWVAYASHDYAGDNLRRRWDDPEVEKIDDHPIIYVGAGSHASYFQSGEYLTELELKFLSPLVKLSQRVSGFWHRQMRQYQAADASVETGETSNIFRIPFVDYARGDGVSIGPGQELTWEKLRLLRGTEAWLTRFRGLWGLYARDPFAGENAPAGPMFERSHRVRRVWYDPVGWSGLDKVAPPDEAVAIAQVQQHAARRRRTELRAQIEGKAQILRGLGVESAAIRDQPHLQDLLADNRRRMAELSDEIDSLRRMMVTAGDRLLALRRYEQELCAGKKGPARLHIQRAHTPTGAEELRAGQLAEIWAAASIGLMLVWFVALIYFARQYIVFGLVAFTSVFMFLEATFRGRLVRLVTSVTIGLAIAAALVLLYEFFWWIIAAGVLTIGGYLLWENLRELIRS